MCAMEAPALPWAAEGSAEDKTSNKDVEISDDVRLETGERIRVRACFLLIIDWYDTRCSDVSVMPLLSN